MPEMSSLCEALRAGDQLVASARTTLIQVQTMLATQSDEGARRLREAQVAFIAARRDRSSAHRRLMRLLLMNQNLITRRLEDRVLLRKESLLVKDIPPRKPSSEAGYGVMMLREKSE